jgi:hypothetical protein
VCRDGAGSVAVSYCQRVLQHRLHLAGQEGARMIPPQLPSSAQQMTDTALMRRFGEPALLQFEPGSF